MIWSSRRILPETELLIPLEDRIFEHGLGLFETFRTWSGRPLWLARHLARLERSANALGIPFNPRDLPHETDISALLHAAGHQPDARLRLTMTGGTASGQPAVVWLAAGAIPPNPPSTGFCLGSQILHISRRDPLAQHKTLNYWNRRIAFEQARAMGADESLVCTPDHRVWECTRMNLFLIRGNALHTPLLDGPVLPGITREVVLQLAREQGLEIHETEIERTELPHADELFLTNSVRGIVPVARLPERAFASPGPLTRRLAHALRQHLQHGVPAT